MPDAGPVLAGLIVAGAGPDFAFAIDSRTFAVSTLSLALLRLPRMARRWRACRPTRGLARGHRPHVGLDDHRPSRSRTWRSRRSSAGPFVANGRSAARRLGLDRNLRGIGAVLERGCAAPEATPAARRQRPAVSLWALEWPCSLGPSYCGLAKCAALGFAGASLERALVHGAPAPDPAEALSGSALATGWARSSSARRLPLRAGAAAIGIPATLTPPQPCRPRPASAWR
jgi:hypothetical protein